MSKTRSRQSARVKRYRKLYAAAKRKGLVKGDKSAKTLVPSRYMVTKLNKLETYLGPDYAAPKVSRGVRAAFKEAPSEIVPMIVSGRAIVKRAPGQRVGMKGGVLSIRTKLTAGTFEELPLPVSVKTLADFREWIEANPYYNAILKHDREVFNFRIFQNDSYNSYGNIEALIGDLENYANEPPEGYGSNIEGEWVDSEDLFTHFQLFRSYKDWTAPEHAERKRIYQQRQRQEHRERKYNRLSPERKAAFDERQRDLRAARRAAQPGYQQQKKEQKKKRKTETPEQRAARLAKQRARMATLRAKRGKN